MHQYLLLWPLLQRVQLQPQMPDQVCWRWTANKQYSAQSAYETFFCGSTSLQGANWLWKAWAPPKCKLFMYLALQGRTWTAERRFRHGLQDSDTCSLCSQEPETVAHLLLHCVVPKEVWWAAMNFIELPQRFSTDRLDIPGTWERLRAGLTKDKRKGMDTLFILISWSLWKERNNRTFNNVTTATPQLIKVIKDEARAWVAAGARNLCRLLPRE